MKKDSSEYNSRKLLMILGVSPQIITETIYGLMSLDNFHIPTQVDVITTKTGKAIINKLLFDSGKYKDFLVEYNITNITFSKDNVVVLKDIDGQELSDINSEKTSLQAADQISHRVQNLTKEPNSQVIVSLAGGRKTMGFYAGYALSLFGRPQDRLTHVLVSPGYDGEVDFFYPSKKDEFFENKQGNKLNKHNASVEFIDVPFVRLRKEIPKDALTNQHSFSETVSILDSALQPANLIINLATKEITCHGKLVNLTETLFFDFVWLAYHQIKENEPFPLPNKDLLSNNDPELQKLNTSFISFSECIDNNCSIFDRVKIRMNYTNLNKSYSKIKNKLKEQLGEAISEKYLPVNTGPRNNPCYQLQLDKSQITIKNSRLLAGFEF